MFFICVRFHENISNGLQLIELSRVHGGNGYVQCSKGNNSESRPIRVMVNVFFMSSHGVLHLSEVS